MIINTLEHVFKNKRYKLLYVNGDYYIYDADRIMVSIMFPFIYWIISHPVYQIDKTTYEKLKMPDEEKRSKMWMVFPATGIAMILGRQLAAITEKFNGALSHVLTIVVLAVLIAIILYFRIYLHHYYYNKLTSKIELESLPKKNIKMKPIHLGGYIEAFFLYFFSLGMSLLFGFGYVEISNVFVGIIFATVASLFLLVNMNIIPTGSVKVTYVEDNNKLS